MHVVTFTFCVCNACAQSKHGVKECLVSLWCQRWSRKDRWQSQRIHLLLCRHLWASLCGFMGHLKVGASAEEFRRFTAPHFLLVPQNCNYTVQHAVCDLWSLQSKRTKNVIEATLAASTSESLSVWTSRFSAVSREFQYYINEILKACHGKYLTLRFFQ